MEGVRIKNSWDDGFNITLCVEGAGAIYLKNTQLDSVITALTSYRDSLPKPCPHAELIKQYAEDCQKYEKPWELWQFYEEVAARWGCLNQHPRWYKGELYRRIGESK